MADAIESQGYKFEIGNGDSPLTYTEVVGVTNFSGFDGSAAEIDVTHLGSTAKEWLMGLQDFGNYQLDCNFLPEDDGQNALRDAKGTRDLQLFKVTRSDGSTATFYGYVLSASESGGVDSKVDTSFNLRISGDVTYAEAP